MTMFPCRSEYPYFLLTTMGTSPSENHSAQLSEIATSLIKHSDIEVVAVPSTVDQGVLSQASALAIRLDDPGQEPVLLLRQEIEGFNLAFGFPATELEPGPWLIYPAVDSTLQFRPMLWAVGRLDSPVCVSGSSLGEILRVTDDGERHQQLQAAILKMAGDFDDAGWSTVERFAHQLYHLPFCTLDLWREFSVSPEGLAALAVRSYRLPTGFLERYSGEMPAFWEAMPLSAWIQAMKAHLRSSKTESTLASDLTSRVEAIASVHPSLRAVLEISQSVSTGVATQDVRIAQCVPPDFFVKQLFSGDNSPYQQLLRECADSQWLTDFQEYIARARSGCLAKFLRTVDASFRDTVVNLPILLAASIATGKMLGWVRTTSIRRFRKYQDFCPEWFSEAFDLTVARCISERLVGD